MVRTFGRLGGRAPGVEGSGGAFLPDDRRGGRWPVYIVWFDDRAGPLNVWAKRSTDGGRTWSADVRLSRPEGIAGIYGEYGGAGIDGRGALHVTWGDGTGHVSRDGKGTAWYARWDGRVP
jgi:hypothetical protein